ncbi:unnamed protein product [Camellia sinensis]
MMEAQGQSRQRVVVIQDASKEVSSRAVKWVLLGLSLKQGDTITLLSVVHQLNNPMGYTNRMDSSIFSTNKKFVDEEVAKKKKEYLNDEELTHISNVYQKKKIMFKVEVVAGPSPKVVALEEAIKLRATWVILDRQMKKDKEYFMEKLSCGISRMKRDNHIEKLRGPKERSHTKIQLTYDKMIPGSSGGDDHDLFSIDLPQYFTPSLESTDESTSSSLSTRKGTPYPSPRENNTDQRIETVKIMASLDGIPNKYEIDSTQSSSKEDLITPPLKPEKYHSYDHHSICTICKNRRPTMANMGGWKKDFTYAELQAATNGFSQDNIIFRRGYGSIFRGRLKDKLAIAIKEHKDTSFHGENKFNSEVKLLNKARHKNVVMLLGSCLEGSQRLLVYEYVCNGSLNQHLRNSRPLTWGARMTIALGVSRGIKHLHANNIIHRDITTNNILVTHDLEPLLGGFGIATTEYESDDQSDHSRVMGTFGYLAPEYAESGKASYNTDIYSFGVILLELITGRTTKDNRLEGKSLLGWAKPLLKQKKYDELIDPRIFNSHDDTHQFSWTIQLSGNCVAKDPQNRPSMDKVVSTLEHIMEGKNPWEGKT